MAIVESYCYYDDDDNSVDGGYRHVGTQLCWVLQHQASLGENVDGDGNNGSDCDDDDNDCIDSSNPVMENPSAPGSMK